MSPPKTDSTATSAWDPQAAQSVLTALWDLRRSLLQRQAELQPLLDATDPRHRSSAANLVHYLALRETDLRKLQDRLAWIGVSSLGRAETHVLANVDKVLGLLHRITGQAWTPLSGDEPAGYEQGGARLQHNAQALLGPPGARRSTRIMVTMPSEAAHDTALVRRLVDAGMDVARINCAHDGPEARAAIAQAVRQAATRAGRAVKVLMDLGGPKLRTGTLPPGPAVLRLRPQRDELGRVTAPAMLGLVPQGQALVLTGADTVLGAHPLWLAQVRRGDSIRLTDTRGARRTLTVLRKSKAGVLASCEHTAYLGTDTQLQLRRKGSPLLETAVGPIPCAPGVLGLQRGDTLHLLADGEGHEAQPANGRRKARPAAIACTLPQVFSQARRGQRVWFDDGRIGGVIRGCSARRLEITITEARDGGDRLAADKGINLPDTDLQLPALTAQDLQDLDSVARLADMVGLSFAQSADDLHALRGQLAARGADHLGVIVKIETQRGFAHLPQMLLAAMAWPAAGVMIARGDLAVECGWERLAEVQEEILWACEAAHLPVVWATQVLETLAKTGAPSRAEITDAAMGARAECVMLNKGPHIIQAMQTLDDILGRMHQHQSKKRPLLRALRSWRLALPA